MPGVEFSQEVESSTSVIVATSTYDTNYDMNMGEHPWWDVTAIPSFRCVL